MANLTSDQINKLNKMNRASQIAELGTRISEIQTPATVDEVKAGDNNTKYITSAGLSAYDLIEHTSLSGSAAIGVASINVHAIPRGMTNNQGWIVIDPYTNECEIRKITTISSLTLNIMPLTYAHSSGDTVFWITDPIVKASWFGAKGDAEKIAGLSINNGSNTLTSSSAVFNSYDVGKNILVYQAASGSETLVTTITDFIGSTEVELADVAGASASGVNGVIGTATQTSIMRAIDSISGAVTILFEPNGLYLLTAPVSITTRSNVAIEGNLCTFYKDTQGAHYSTYTGDGAMFEIDGPVQADENDYLNNFIFKNFYGENVGQSVGFSTDAGYYNQLNGVGVSYYRYWNKRINTDPVINLRYCRDVIVENVHSYRTGRLVSGDGYTGNVLVTKCRIRDCGNVGVSAGHKSKIFNNIFLQNSPEQSSTDGQNQLGTSHAVYIYSSHDDVQVIGNTFKGIKTPAVQFNTNATDGFLRSIVALNTFEDCHSVFYGRASGGSSIGELLFTNNVQRNSGNVNLEGAGMRFIYRGNVANGNCSWDASSGAVIPIGAKEIIIENNYFDGFSGTNQAGIYGGIYSATEQLRISDNYFGPNNYHAIYLHTCELAARIEIENNTFDGCGAHSIRISTAFQNDPTYTDNFIVSRNTFLLRIAGALLIETPGLKIIDNIFNVPGNKYVMTISGSSGTNKTTFAKNTINSIDGTAYVMSLTSVANASLNLLGNIYSGQGVVNLGDSGSALNRCTGELNRILTFAPANPLQGDLVFADGSSWNPGSGRGIYAYISGSWVNL